MTKETRTMDVSIAAGTPRHITEPRWRTWIRLFRPHHAPLTLTAGIAGMAVAPESPTTSSIAVGALICFAGYPLGQVFNDYADREADRINAPHRPFVSGAINPVLALSVTFGIALVLGIWALLVAPAVMIWGAVAIVGNAIYSAVKGVPMVGNVANGLDLALFVLIGAAAAAPERGVLEVPGEVLLYAGLVAVMLSAFCLLSYFKDIEGDRAAGYRTLPVVLGAQGARFWTIPIPLAGLAATCVLAIAEPAALGAESATASFWVLLALAAGAFGMSVARVIQDPVGRAYDVLLWSVRGAVLFALALGAMPEPQLVAAVAVPVVLFMELAYLDTRRFGQA